MLLDELVAAEANVLEELMMFLLYLKAAENYEVIFCYFFMDGED